VAASLTALGLAARVVSPVLAAALLDGVLPVIPPAGWELGPPQWGPVDAAARPDDGVVCPTPAALAAAFVRHCLEPVALPLVRAVGAPSGVSATVLVGNVTSAVAGAAGMIARQRPDVAGPASDVMVQLLAEGPLAGTGTWERRDNAPSRTFLRRSCCLLYRLPGAAPCGDCVLLLRGPRGTVPGRERPPDPPVGKAVGAR
jgi:hypothetical protein